MFMYHHSNEEVNKTLTYFHKQIPKENNFKKLRFKTRAQKRKQGNIIKEEK